MRLRAPFVAAITLVSTCILVVLAGLPMYVFPQTDRISHVDAVVVLGPATRERLELAKKYYVDGKADVLLSSVATEGPYRRANVHVCDNAGVICFVPTPFQTRGEAAAVEDLARRYGWESVLVITGTPHVTRARFIFERCTTLQVSVDDVNETRGLGDWAYAYAYQSAAFVKAVIAGCT